MIPPRMRAIEYNMLMSLGTFMHNEISVNAMAYGLHGNIDIISAYAKDLTKFHKPSIIIQKVHTTQSSVGFGNVLGQYMDADDNRQYDVSGRVHEMTVQFDIVAQSRTVCTLLASLIGEDILRRVGDTGSGTIIRLNDYIDDINNPVQVGRLDISDEVDIMYMESNDNKDFTSVVRTEFRTIQSIINISDYVDLSKGIKYIQTVRI